MDTTFGYCDKDNGFFSSDEFAWITRIRKWAEEYPDEVIILKQPEENYGCIYAKVPPDWLKRMGPKKHHPMTDEQKAVAAERLRKMREAKTREEEEQDE